MPYVRPPTSPDDVSHDLPPLKLRPKHRRTRSATTFSDERGPGAFVGFSHLPRRKSQSGERKAQFHFNDPDSDSSDDTSGDNNNALQLTVDTKNIPSNVPSSEHNSPMNPDALEPSSLPFPSRGSPNASPLPPPSPISHTYSGSSASTGSIPRTPSTPVILSNGKPLKSSLKSSQSAPHFLAPRLHTRAQSEPATPAGGPKNVHFAGDESLRSVRLFKSTGKPVNVSRNAEETETETEYDSSNPAPEPSAYPFPIVAPRADDPPTFEVDWTRSSSIPTENINIYANVHTETILLPKTGPPMMRGAVLVRNLAFAKDVAVRFTLDNWSTTSEVICKHVVSLPSLPPPFPSPSSLGDKAAAQAQSSTWDRFSFVIRLEDFERKLHEKTMFFVVRYTAPGVGEWWDNNNGQNYRISFKKLSETGPAVETRKTAIVIDSNRLSPVMGNSQQRTFSAPPTLKGTPTTEAVQASAPLAKISLPTGSQRQHRASMFAARPSPPTRHNSSPQPTLSSFGVRTPTQSMRSSAPTKLNLLNYAAPAPAKTPASAGPLETRFVGLSDASQPVQPNDHGLTHHLKEMSLVNGMPATAPKSNFAWPPSNSSSTQSLSGSTPPPSYSALPIPSETNRKDGSSSPLPTDSSYAAFVKQWCFVQSPTPSPSVSPPTSSGASTPRASAPAMSSAWRAALGMDGFGGGMYSNGMRSDSPMLASM